MRNYYGAPSSRYSGRAVRFLVMANVVIFALTFILRGFPWFYTFGLVPAFLFSRLMLWQMVTYLFLHGGLWHLVINMLMLWMFGSVVENAWGDRRFLIYYFFTGIAAGLCSYLFAFNSLAPVVGASGAIFGILVAYAVMFPDSIILMFLIFPMKMKHAIVFLAGVNLLGALSSPGSNIAYMAHLGGGLFGFIYLKSNRLRHFFESFSPAEFFARRRDKQQQARWERDRRLEEEMDRILDKISSQGMESLSAREKRFLKERGRQK